MGGHRNVTTYAESVIGTSSPLPSFDPICPTSAFPIQIGGKWTAMVVLCLEGGPRRFGVLRRHLRPISAKVLAETLAAMGRDGLVRRCLAEGDDGGVEYELTSLGRSLLDVIEHARGWARCHLDELMRARAGFDQAGQSAGGDGQKAAYDTGMRPSTWP
ncbi:hypothetical protein Pa4123_61430 [Phytohabitans aurantiacus]|uniref:HTH hxlR-type domain-containing protein n=1 Tax=Phytohabitans aurantiacus TaxID=3016789 RepID=A0ABQ5R4S2_9ACTN|nr:hypothetical protein Pa4123_61430 [Phytohabitans aurantiacus]